MVSPRPWKLDYSWGVAIRGPDDNDVVPSCPSCEVHEDDCHYIVACVNAIHAAGIQPADVAAMVEAVRAHARAKAFMDNAVEYPTVESHGLWTDAAEKLDAAASLLPERKSE